VGPENPFLFGAALDDIEIEAIELLPHARAALFTNMTQIFARVSDAGDDGRSVGTAEDKGVEKLRRIDGPGYGRRAESFQQKTPSAGAEFGRLIEPELKFRVNQP